MVLRRSKKCIKELSCAEKVRKRNRKGSAGTGAPTEPAARGRVHDPEQSVPHAQWISAHAAAHLGVGNGSKLQADQPAIPLPPAQSLARRVLFAGGVRLHQASGFPPQESLVQKAARLASSVRVWALEDVEDARSVPDVAASLPVDQYRSHTKPPSFSPPGGGR